MADSVNCPQCGSARVEKVKFTAWGGMIGPRLLNHVSCQDCKATFNGKTGKSNSRAIVAYLVGTLVIVFLLYYLITIGR